MLVIVGEDYGEGSSIMQERGHAFAMKSQMWLLDPRPNLPSIVAMVEKGFELSEASHTPVMLELRVRECHLHGRFQAKDNVRPRFTCARRSGQPGARHRAHRPAAGELPARAREDRKALARRYQVHHDQKLNERFDGEGDIGIIVQGGLFNTLSTARWS